jgi:hypothetical protein
MSETAVKTKQSWQDAIEEARELSPAIREWMDSLGWKNEEIIGLDLTRPLYPVGADEQGILTFKPSSYFIMTVQKRPSEDGKESAITKVAIFGTGEDGKLQLM